MPPAFRFSLRTLMLSVAGIGLSITTWQTIGPVWALTSLLLMSVVFAHVAGNALGCHLRDTSAQRAKEALEKGLDEELPPRTTLADLPRPVPPTRLSQRTSLGWFLPIITSLGGMSGAGAAAWYMCTRYWSSVTPGSLVVGAGATGVLTGLLTFWIFSLLQVFVGAWWQAREIR